MLDPLVPFASLRIASRALSPHDHALRVLGRQVAARSPALVGLAQQRTELEAICDDIGRAVLALDAMAHVPAVAAGTGVAS